MLENLKTILYVVRFMIVYSLAALVPLVTILGLTEVMVRSQYPVLVLFGFLLLCMLIHMIGGVILCNKRKANENEGLVNMPKM